MADVPTVSIVDGIPTSGTGTVMTLSQVVAALETIFGATALADGPGTGDARTLRFLLDSSQEGATGGGVASAAARIVVQNDTLWPVGLPAKVFAATFSTLTRPANTTPYSAGDSISDNATAGSVTALSATVSDVNDDPIMLAGIELKSTDTGFGGKQVRAYVYNANPTSSSGVGGGDNAAFSNKQAGFVGTFLGTLKAFSDGAAGLLVPEESTPCVIAYPVSGAKTLYIQYQAVDAATPSANSTTFIGKIKGVQARAL